MARRVDDLIEALLAGRAKAEALVREQPELLAAKNNAGETALHCLVQEDARDAVRLAMAIGANVDVRDEARSTPLHTAAFLGHREMVLLLLELGARVDALDDERRTPLHRAVACGEVSLPLIEPLLAAGAKVATPDDQGDTVLHTAVKNGSTPLDVIGALLKSGADPLAKNRFNATPIELARGRKRSDVVQLLKGVKAE